MQKILIPTDFSENAWNAISYAMHLFRNRKCTFYFLNTYTPVIPSSRFMANMVDGVRIVDAVRDASEKGLQQTVERVTKEFNNSKELFHSIVLLNSFMISLIPIIGFSMFSTPSIIIDS